MPRDAPRVSVGLPVRNGEPYLEEAIDSLLGQSFDDFELIISDNASTDRTEALCRAYARRDERVRFERSPVNRGAAWNYNRVLALARGDYFKWAAHDDVCAPTLLERCVAELDSHPRSVVLSYPRTRIRWEEGDLVWEHCDNLDIRHPEPHARLRHLILNFDMAHPVFGLMRRQVLRRTRGIGSYPSSDWVLLAELALLGEFHEVPEYLFLRRIHSGMSREANVTSRQVAEWFLPGTGQHRQLEYWRVFVEILSAIRRRGLNPRDRLLAYATFVPDWLIPWRKWLALELLRLPPQLVRRLLTATGSHRPTAGR